MRIFHDALRFMARSQFVAKYMLKWRFEKRLTQTVLAPRESYDSRNFWEDGIETALLRDITCGVHVVWGEQKSVTTSSVLSVVKRLQFNNKFSGVLIVSGNEAATDARKSLFSWLKARFDLPPDGRSVFLSELIDSGDKVLLVLDKFDYLMTHPNCKSFLTSLAEDSVKTKRFTVLAVVTKEAFYKEILTWNDGQKIRRCF